MLSDRNLRRRNATAIILCIAAVLCIEELLMPNSSWNYATVDEREYDIDEDLLETDEQLHRFLLRTLDESKLMDRYAIPDNFTAVVQSQPQDVVDEESSGSEEATTTLESPVISPYTLQDAINEANVFRFTFAVLIYDPKKDKFIQYYAKNHLWRSSNRKLETSIRELSYMLRKTFPERFTKNSTEFALAVSSGDYPHVNLGSIPHSHGVAPVLQFGSVFQDEKLYPNMIAMPMPGLHLGCFTEWANFGHVCKGLRPVMSGAPQGEQPFGEELGLEWDNLIPQIIWRGSDFSYLPTLMKPRSLQPLNNHIENAVKSKVSEHTDKRDKMLAATQALREHYGSLLPRWKGALLAAEAELEAKGDEVPWANIKFATYYEGGRSNPTKGSDKYKTYDDLDIATGQYMASQKLAQYKYQIDIGGGGGTSWTGTTIKLSMPGLLFHHITPTKDYFYDQLKPWEHYVPVRPDLRDLKSKFDWAENHPEQATKIADQSTDVMRHWASPEGFEQLYGDVFVEPLKRIIEAYQPMSTTGSDMSWGAIVGSTMVPVLECNGLITDRSACEVMGGEVVQTWQRQGRYPHEVSSRGIMQN